MKAIRIHRHGGPEVLQIDDIPESTPKENEVKVRTKATSLNHMDLWVRKGIPGIGNLPLVLGCDLSGTVESVGKAVTRFKAGDRVVLFPLLSCGECKACKKGDVNLCRDFKIPGEHVDGTHREFVTAPESQLIKLDDRIDFATAAAFPLVYMTAWHMVVANGKIEKDMDVLVMAAGSGVGSAAVEIAKHFGARIITTASGVDKLAHAKKIGADHVIDHYAEKISERVKEITNKKGVELVIEHVGEKVFGECLKSLSWGGRLVTCGATSGPKISIDLRHIFIKQQQIIGSTMGRFDEFEKIHTLVANGELKPQIAKKFRFDDIKAAHEYLETSKNFGKVILEWS
jgi:NADPH:quinone reductase-like Zn-dependent oxidoreductase